MAIIKHNEDVKILIDGNNIVNAVNAIDIRLRPDEIVSAEIKLFPEQIDILVDRLYTEIEGVKYLLVRTDGKISLPIIELLKEAKAVIENLQIEYDSSSGSGGYWDSFRELLLAKIMKPEHEEVYRKMCRFIEFNERSDK